MDVLVYASLLKKIRGVASGIADIEYNHDTSTLDFICVDGTIIKVPLDAYNKTEVDALLTAKVDIANIVTSLSSSSTDAQIPSAKTVFDAIESVSGGVPTDVYSKTDVDGLLANKANTSDIIDAYNKTEVDGLMNAKANANDVYAKTDVDNLLSAKADSADIIDAYTKDEVDDLLADKADSSSLIDAYTKEEVNNLLDDKVNTDDLVDAYSKEEVNNLLNSKADSSAIVDSYSKTEVDTLLTGKADSSSIIDAYNKTEVDDLLTDKVNTTSVVTTLSSTNVDEEIPSAKAVYDAIKNVSAGVPADVYSKTEVDNLLDAKADTDAIIDAYNKTEVDDLLADKADSSDIIDAYNKTEVDGLLADKANVDDIVDSYTKTETDDLLTAKANTTALDSKVNKTAIVTSVSSTSTDEQVPSAKAVHTAIQEAKTELENEITNIPKVTKTSELTNDSGFITANDIPDVDLEPYALKTQIPTTLPASDVYDWAKASTKPTYTASEVGALASNGTAVNASKVEKALTLKIAGTTKNTFDGSTAQFFNIPNASTSESGVMTSAMVTKLNGIATGANLIKTSKNTAKFSSQSAFSPNISSCIIGNNTVGGVWIFTGTMTYNISSAPSPGNSILSINQQMTQFEDVTIICPCMTANNAYITLKVSGGTLYYQSYTGSAPTSGSRYFVSAVIPVSSTSFLS